ncbi:TIP-1 family-domain-containing protein [Schizophyllum amplum]|uniref:TIP-1 family-domain-containing protein n=1 Tax=Schizophyllum amplum TaxID=97359 RepID=A0A550CN35_9AGAR|nr:TIP-1 family-domain-containing protein [Auriculariopsis ampla]
MSAAPGETTLLEDIETQHRNLKELSNVKGYVQLLEKALNLSEAALAQTGALAPSQIVTPASLEKYSALQNFVSQVDDYCSSVEDGSGQRKLHLVYFLEEIREKTWSDIKQAMSISLLAAAEKLKWPMAVDYASADAETRKAFEHAFYNLLRLQDIGGKMRSALGTEKSGLYPLQALVRPVALRFKYHFEGTRQTNRLDKPEWYLTHVANVAHEHRTFMDSVIQALLNASEHRNIIASREFTYCLLPLVQRKLKRTMPSLLQRSSLLAHTIYQTLSFDAALVEEGFSLYGTSAAASVEDPDHWEGVSETVLGTKEWFDAWMDGEKHFAEEQYRNIISAADAWQIADDDAEESAPQLKTTNAARRVKALVEQITDRYSPLPNATRKMRFLTTVQLPILEHYQGRISSSLDAFETLSSALLRAVPGALSFGGKEEGGMSVDTQRLTAGVEGVKKLAKALLSARYLEVALQGWGEDLIFLELWAEINRFSGLKARVRASALLPEPTAEDDAAPENTIFDTVVAIYHKLVVRAEDMIVLQVSNEVENTLKPHLQRLNSPDASQDLTDEINVSQTLLPAIALLSAHLTFLRTTLPTATAATVYRRIASSLAEHILQRAILYRGRLSLQEGRRCAAEGALWLETCAGALGGALPRSRLEAPWLRLLQAGRLVAAEGPAWAEVVSATFGPIDEKGWQEAVVHAVGIGEMGREEVGRVLRRREGFQG